MNANMPSVSVRPDHFQLSGEIGLFVLHISSSNLRLEVAPVLDPVGRVDVDHLHLARQVFSVGKRRHDLQAVTQDHPVRPVDVVLIELDRLVVLLLGVAEERPLDILPCCHLEDRLG